MGYACPVCETPQRDGEHLANHLAFTAMLHGDEHEAWLDERAPGWGEERPAELAERVTPHATETEYDEVFEDTVGSEHDHAAGAGGFESMAGSVADDAVESVLREAEELTEEMYGLDDESGEGTEAGSADDSGDAGTEGDPDDGEE